jgi:hypothetical protein
MEMGFPRDFSISYQNHASIRAFSNSNETLNRDGPKAELINSNQQKRFEELNIRLCKNRRSPKEMSKQLFVLNFLSKTACYLFRTSTQPSKQLVEQQPARSASSQPLTVLFNDENQNDHDYFNQQLSNQHGHSTEKHIAHAFQSNLWDDLRKEAMSLGKIEMKDEREPKVAVNQTKSDECERKVEGCARKTNNLAATENKAAENEAKTAEPQMEVNDLKATNHEGAANEIKAAEWKAAANETEATEKKTIKNESKTGNTADHKGCDRKTIPSGLKAAECECERADELKAAERDMAAIELAAESERTAQHEVGRNDAKTGELEAAESDGDDDEREVSEDWAVANELGAAEGEAAVNERRLDERGAADNKRIAAVCEDSWTKWKEAEREIAASEWVATGHEMTGN